MLSPPCDDDKHGASRALYRAYTYTTCPSPRERDAKNDVPLANWPRISMTDNRTLHIPFLRRKGAVRTVRILRHVVVTMVFVCLRKRQP